MHFSFSSEEIEFLICCTEEDHEGKIDYAAFKETYYEPSKAIGFNMAVLLTNLSEHMTTDPRLNYCQMFVPFVNKTTQFELSRS